MTCEACLDDPCLCALAAAPSGLLALGVGGGWVGFNGRYVRDGDALTVRTADHAVIGAMNGYPRHRRWLALNDALHFEIAEWFAAQDDGNFVILKALHRAYEPPSDEISDGQAITAAEMWNQGADLLEIMGDLNCTAAALRSAEPSTLMAAAGQYLRQAGAGTTGELPV